MSNKNIHDKGIQERIRQIEHEDRFSLLAVIPNVNYISRFNSEHDICGELDILKLYFNGVIGIEEVKSTEKGFNKAQAQLKRAGEVFKFYNPKLATYIANKDEVIKYQR